jgi:hypothetical protein
MKYLFLLFSIAMAIGLKAQLDCKETFTMKVTAKSGLNMRDQPNTKATVIATIPYDNILITCASTSGKLVIGETNGFWRQASYEGKLGYVYDAYLELVDPAKRKGAQEKDVVKINEKETGKPDPMSTTPAPPAEKEVPEKSTPDKKEALPEKIIEEKTITPQRDYSLLLEAYNYCGAVEEIDPGILWYGFYPADRELGETNMNVKPVELEIVLSKSRSGKTLEFDIRTDREERSLFMIGSNRPLELQNMDLTDRSELMRYSNQKVFPGQQINIELNGKQVSLSATGGISSTGDCPELENYKLLVQADKSFDLMQLLPEGQCGLPEIYWFGDLNGDQLPDFIVVSIFEERNIFSLLVSKEDPMMTKVAEWSTEKCTD